MQVGNKIKLAVVCGALAGSAITATIATQASNAATHRSATPQVRVANPTTKSKTTKSTPKSSTTRPPCPYAQGSSGSSKTGSGGPAPEAAAPAV